MKRPRVLLLNLSGWMPLHKQNGCTVLSTRRERRETTKSSSIEFIGLDATAQAKWLHSLIHKCFFFFFIKDLLLLLIFPEQRIFRKKRAFMCKFCQVRDVNKICK